MGTDAEVKIMPRIIKLDQSQRLDLAKYEPDQIERSKEISKSLVTTDTNSILNYGLELQTKLSTYSSEILGSVRNIDTGEIGGIIQDLLSELNIIKIEESSSNPIVRFLESLPILKNLVRSTKKILDKYDKVSGNLDNIVVKLDKGRSSLLKDINVLDKMFIKNVEFIDDVEAYILAAKMKVEEMEQTVAEMEVSENVEPFEIQDSRNYLDGLKKKLVDLQLTRAVTVQSLPQIRVVQANNSVMVSKIQSAVTNTIPLWRNSICLAVMLDKQKRIVEVQKSVNKATNDILLKNSEILRENSIDVAKINEETIVDVDTLKKVNQDLMSTLDEILKIKNEGDAKRIQIQKDLEVIDNEIKQKVMDTKLLLTGKK